MPRNRPTNNEMNMIRGIMTNSLHECVSDAILNEAVKLARTNPQVLNEADYMKYIKDLLSSIFRTGEREAAEAATREAGEAASREAAEAGRATEAGVGPTPEPSTAARTPGPKPTEVVGIGQRWRDAKSFIQDPYGWYQGFRRGVSNPQYDNWMRTRVGDATTPHAGGVRTGSAIARNPGKVATGSALATGGAILGGASLLGGGSQTDNTGSLSGSGLPSPTTPPQDVGKPWVPTPDTYPPTQTTSTPKSTPTTPASTVPAEKPVVVPVKAPTPVAPTPVAPAKPAGSATPKQPLTTSGRQTGLGAGQTLLQPDSTWDEVAARHVPENLKGQPLSRRDGVVYAGDVPLSTGSRETSHYAPNAPTRAEMDAAAGNQAGTAATPRPTRTTSGRQTGLGAGQTLLQPDSTWDEVAAKYIPDRFKHLPITRRNGVVYAGDIEMTAATQETQGKYTDDAPTRAEMESVQESYYHRLSRRLDEALGIDQGAYGYNPKGGRKTARLRRRYAEEPMASWSGDSSDVEDLPVRGSKGGKGSTDADTFVKHHVIKFMTQAQDKGIELTHGQAHRMALDLLRQHLGQ